jgi:hypothetical protein
VLKDRYNQVWALNTPSGSVRWTYSGNVGHYPWPYDFDGDGRDELMAGYDLLDDDGQRLWTASGMSDHADSMWVADFNEDGYPDIASAAATPAPTSAMATDCGCTPAPPSHSR